MVVDRDGTVQLLNQSLSTPIGLYSTDRRIFAFFRELPVEGTPPVTEILGEAFAVHQDIRAVLWANHKVRVE